MRILLVEDNADHRELMCHALSKYDLTWQVDGIATGEEALRRLAEGGVYDLVFLDYSLPGRGGLEVLEEIRRGEAPPPVVMVTGRGDEQVAVEAIKGGAYDYVVKGEGYLRRLPVVARRAMEAHLLDLEYKRAEQALRASEEKYRLLFETAPFGIGMADPAGNVLAFNSAMEKITGFTPEDWKTMRLEATYVDPDERRQLLRTLQESGQVRDREVRLKRKDGTIYTAMMNIDQIKVGGRMVLYTNVRDITARKKQEILLEESEMLNKALFEYNPIESIHVDLEGRILTVNLAKRQSGERLPHIGDVMYKDYAAKHEIDMYGHLQECLRTKEVKEFSSLKYRDKYLHVKIAPFLHGAIITSLDITPQVMAEKALSKSEMMYRALFENVGEAIFILDLDRKILAASNKAGEMFDFNNKEFIGMSFVDLLVASEIQKFQDVLEVLPDGPAFPLLQQNGLKKNGNVFPVEINLSVIHGLEKEPFFFQVVVRDISERRKAEKEKEKLQTQLLLSERMAGIGVLAGGISHEFNNLLQIMSGVVQCADKTGKLTDIQEAFDTVLKTSDRAAKIIKNLLTFSNPHSSQMEFTDLRHLIDLVFALAEGQLKKKNIKVVRHYENIPLVRANVGEIQQVFFNLMLNARDAMFPKGGTLSVGAGVTDGRVEISFKDTGHGISKENMNRIFDPFFTTKGAFGKSSTPGTGLGLAVSYAIVTRHQGSLEVESEVGQGTTFRIYFPIAEAEKRPRRRPAKKAAAAKFRPKRILVVDDEEDICKTIIKYLSFRGHKAEYAMTGSGALRKLKKRHFDFVLVDMIMPGLSSVGLINKIKQIKPSLKLIAMSGDLANSARIAKTNKKGVFKIIQKPFQIEEIAEMFNK